MRRHVFPCLAALALCQAASAQSRGGYAHGTIFGDIGPRGNTWTEDVPNNRLYHNDGGGVRKFILNGTTPADGNTFLTVNADVSGFFGMAVISPNTTAVPFYAYRTGTSGTDRALHSFNPANGGSWSLSINGSTVLSAFTNGNVTVAGNMEADAYRLSSSRSDFQVVTSVDPGALNGGDIFYKLILPDGADVVQYQAKMTDNNGSAVLRVHLARVSTAATSVDILETIESPPGTGQTSKSVTGVTVDNDTYAYYIVVDGLENGNLSFFSARVQYTVDEL